MNYLLDRKVKKRKNWSIAILIVVLFFMIYFRGLVASGLSYAGSTVFRPALVLGKNIGGKFSGASVYFKSKQSLHEELEELKEHLLEHEADMSVYNTIVSENTELKEVLNRAGDNSHFTLAAILSKPNQSPYDTLVIDVGSANAIKVGDIVFAAGSVPIGKIAEVYPNSSKVILYSNAEEKTEAVISGKNIYSQLIGRGGGNFEMILPRDLVLEKYTEIALPGITPHTIATVQTIISDPRDAFTKALLTSPVNIFELKFVQVRI